MSERDKKYVKEISDRLTQLNYSPRVLGLFAGLGFGLMNLGVTFVEDDPAGNNFPPYIQGHASDFVSTPVFMSVMQAGWNTNNRALLGTHGVMWGLVVEASQYVKLNKYFGLNPGVADPRDVAACVAGSAFWIAFHTSAKILHDSGACLPIYNALGICHRRFPDAC
jgi:hypothetical protein